ncbi:MAG: trigger factor [Bacillus thermozeamaize]|uniref:Trigger factor n=1 Tax=Bacillus thermozeamaize TaxID=230954 RepID=A0A1Y3PE99_9BACI|nr:MAG: trigger factor [Bacillus thermozeamaize]
MKATWEKIDKNEGVLTVEVEEERVADALDRAFRKVVKQVTVPGFRKGKVPRKIFEARFGVEVLYEEAIDLLLPEAYKQAVEETKIEPVDRPHVDVEQFEQGKPFIFKATVTVKPEVTLGKYIGLEIPEKDFSVSEEDVQAELERRRERVAELVPVEEGPVETGDLIRLDFEGFVDGQPFEGNKAENYPLTVGSGALIPGFEEQLVGMKNGEEKEIQVTFPEDYRVEELKGKEATFRVKIKEIKRKRLPELDDEFAKDVSECETLEELKEEIRKALSEQKEEEKKQYLQDQAVQLAAENAEVEIPQAMIEHEIDHMIHDYSQQLRLQGLDLDTYFKITNTTMEQLREQFRDSAEKRVRHNLVIEAVAKQENIEATEEEIGEELQKLADLYQRPVEEVKQLLGGEDGLQMIAHSIKVRKTMDFLVEKSVTTAVA